MVTTRQRRTLASIVLLIALCAGVATGVVISGSIDGADADAGPASARRFLARYVAPDGRVVRRDQGSDVVSEGQAYAMLISQAVGDRDTFERVWAWTRTHLQRPDGLLSSRWAGGAVADRQPAADADLDAAHALVLAGRRFGRPALTHAGLRIAKAILARETLTTALGPVLVAGPWAVRTRVVNPSYFSPAAFQELGRTTRDSRWSYLEFTSYRIVDQLTAKGAQIPPDWAMVDGRGNATPRPAPGGATERFGFEALRVPIRMAASGTAYGRGLAARTWHFFSGVQPDRLDQLYTLDGRPLAVGQHAAMLAAGATAGAAAGESARGEGLRARAAVVDRSHQTYYGAAWLALSDLVVGAHLADGPV
jgi:endoglucanase